MKIAENHEKAILSSQTMTTSVAAIEMSAHMAEILSKGIYENPMEAAIRETTCNGYDGMTAAGKHGQPVHVHLPTMIEPYFEVQDFGVGMSEENILQNYLRYGHSTKTGNNDEIGGLGLGCKSPFAIVSSFTVRSRYEGVETTYSIYKDGGLPKNTKLTSVPTTECSGITVRFAVPQDMIEKFNQAARQVYQYFTVKPELNINLNYDIDDSKVLATDGKTYAIYANTAESGIRVRMGQVAYNVPSISQFTTIPYVDSMIEGSWGSLVVIDMPIGSVDVAASRESLQLTEKAKSNIEMSLRKISSCFLSKIQETVDKKETLLSVLNDLSVPQKFYRDVTYKGKTLKEWADQLLNHRVEVVTDPVTNKARQEELYPEIKSLSRYDILKTNAKNFSNASYTMNGKGNFYIFSGDFREKVKKGLVFILNDMKNKKGGVALKGRMDILRSIVSTLPIEKQSNLYYIETQDTVQPLIDVALIPSSQIQVIKMSDHQKAYVPKVRTAKKVISDVYLTDRINPVQVDINSIDDEEVEYYVRTSRDEFVSETIKHLPFRFSELRCILEVDKLYVIKKSNWKDIPDHWVEVSRQDVLGKLESRRGELWRTFNYKNLAYSESGDLRKDKLSIRSATQIDLSCGYVGNDGEYKTHNSRYSDILTTKDIFIRPKLVFCDLVYQSCAFSRDIDIKVLLEFNPSDKKLRKQIKAAEKKMVKTIKATITKVIEKNPLLPYLDWSKINFSNAKKYLKV